jgi:hypothetical protein
MAQYFPKGVRRYRLFPRNGPVSRFGRKRRLRMRLLTWRGMSPNATHMYAKIEEEDNPL